MDPFYQEGANLMKILYAASEATPLQKSGGLADVAGSLPKALVKDGVDARVIMPLYGDLKFRDRLEYVTNYSVPVGWRSQYCGLFKAEVNGVTYYFLDNEYYFTKKFQNIPHADTPSKSNFLVSISIRYI